jgi:hypothetical protein
VRNVDVPANSTDARVPGKVWHALAADMGCEMRAARSTMGCKMRSAADMRAKVPAAANMRGKMRGVAAQMRSIAAHVRSKMRSPTTRVSAAGVSATAGPWGSRADTSRQE